jgi:L-ribulose-5-phosphate 3-epimerase
MKRRAFARCSALAAAALAVRPAAGAAAPRRPLLSLSLAQWSLHRAHFGGRLKPLDFPAYARAKFGLAAVELVNVFFMDRARDAAWLGELKKRCEGEGVACQLIMCDREGRIGDPLEKRRLACVGNHRKWLEAAAALGCHSIRVNAFSTGSRDEQHRLVADGLARLGEAAAPLKLAVLVENHGGLSSDGAWLAAVLRAVGRDNVGSLPDFGNFGRYDRYQGLRDLMPFARGVSAKAHDFDKQGNETRTDFSRALRLVLEAGFRGCVGIEYEGRRLGEDAGIVATRDLLLRTLEMLAPEFK